MMDKGLKKTMWQTDDRGRAIKDYLRLWFRPSDSVTVQTACSRSSEDTVCCGWRRSQNSTLSSIGHVGTTPAMDRRNKVSVLSAKDGVDVAQ